MKLVRLKPYDPKLGHKLQRITLGQLNGLRFEQGRWYEVEDHIATELARVNQDGRITVAPMAGLPRAFDITTFEGAKLLSEEEVLQQQTGTMPFSTPMRAPDRTSDHQRPIPAERPALPPAEQAEASEDGGGEEPEHAPEPPAPKEEPAKGSRSRK